MTSARWRSKLGNWVWLIPMSLVACSTIYPIFFTANVALKTSKDYVISRFAITTAPTVQNLLRAWTYAHLGEYFWNSLIVTAGAVVLLWIVCSMAGYALAQMRFKGSRFLFVVILTGMMIPIQVIMVPFYRLMADVDLLNTRVGLILAYTAFNLPFGVYLMTSYYATIPTEILEAAKVDGASVWQSYLRIMLPMGRPALATLGILNTLFCWNDLLLSLLILQQRELRTLMVGVAALRGEYTTDIPLLAAGVIVGALPVILIFLLFQSQITRGITVGAVK